MRKSILLLLSLCCLFILMSIAVWIFVLPSSKKRIENNLAISTNDKQQKIEVKAKLTESNVNQDGKITVNPQPRNHSKPNPISRTALNVSELFGSSNDDQVFKVQSGNIATVTGRQGLRLVINPDDLVNADGKPVNGDITVTLKECTDNRDMLKANVQTMSNGKLLESGGAFYLNITANNSPLQLKVGKSLTAYLPHIKERGMKIFYGDRKEDGTMNWVNAEKLISNSGQIQNERWKFIDFVIEIDSKGIEFYSESLQDGKYVQWRYQIDSNIRNRIAQIIQESRISDMDESCLGDEGFYLLVTDNCRIIINGLTFYATDLPLRPEEVISIRKKVSEYRNQKTRNQRFAMKVISNTELRKFGWINCDRYYEDTAVKKDLLVKLIYPKNIDPSNCAVFMVFKNANSLLNGNQMTLSQFFFRNIPSNAEVSLIALTKTNDKILVGRSTIFKMANYNNIELRLEEIAADKLEPLINSL